jgi:hypothetical protein
MKGLLITAGVFLILGLSIVFWAVGISNTEIRTRNLGKAQQNNCAAYFDKVWKVLQQDAQVANQYKEAFKEIYPDLIAGRYSQKDKDGKYVAGEGTLMKLIVESNPDFKPELYQKLMTAIEGQREGFFVEQQKLIDIDLQHKNMRMTFPKSLVIGKRTDLGIVVIKSLKTDEAYKTGQENDVDLFKKN